MRIRRQRPIPRCRQLFKLNGLVLFLFVAFILSQQELQVSLPHKASSRTVEKVSTTGTTRVSSQGVSEELSILRDLDKDDVNEELMTNTDEAYVTSLSSSKQAAIHHQSSCSRLDPREEISFWIPVSPDLSIASRLEQSIHDDGGIENGRNGKDDFELLCPLPTSQVQIIHKCPHWILQAFDVNGNPKTVGGDEFYVTYHDGPRRMAIRTNTTRTSRHPPTAVAKVHDFANGTYRLDFIQPPLLAQQPHSLSNGPGTITVTFQYTCGMGAWKPPSKARWKSSGAIAVTHSHYPVQVPPPMELFVSPTSSITVTDDDKESRSGSNGSDPTRVFLDWMDAGTKAKMRNESKSDAYKEPILLAFGDSLMQQFIKSWKQTEIPNVGMPLNTTTVPSWMDLLERRLGPELKTLTSGSRAPKEIFALIIGSSTWDILEPQSSGGGGEWEDHASAMKSLIDFIRQRYLNHSKNLRLFWKSPTALHVHIPILENQVFRSSEDGFSKVHNRIKYMSSSRAHELYAVQKRVCRLLQIPFLDVYEMSYLSADHTQIGDGRHYDEEFNRYALQSFLKYNVVDHFWLRYSQSKFNRILRVRQYCPDSWVDTIQAVLLAAITNRQLELDPEESCDKWRNYEPFLSQVRLYVGSKNTSAISKKKKNVAILDERLPFPLSLEILLESGWTPNSIGSPSYQVATEAFEEGTSYLYGMILYDLLSNTTSTLQGHDPETTGNKILSIYDSFTDRKGDIRKCLSELLQTANTIGKMTSRDGYIARCKTDNDRLFNSLVNYIRSKEAQTRGHPTPMEYPSCCM